MMLTYPDECLLQQAIIKKFEKPATWNLRMFRRWLNSPACGNAFLNGLEEQVWDKDHDLIAMSSLGVDAERDHLSRLLLGPCVAIFHKAIGKFYKTPATERRDEKLDFYRYNESRILRLAGIIGTTISSALPITSIVALNYVERTIIRLVIVAIFTMMFSLILIVVTNARRAENFAATAAYVS